MKNSECQQGDLGSTGIEVSAAHNAMALLAFYQCVKTHFYISSD